jgi:hypothetical protein
MGRPRVLARLLLVSAAMVSLAVGAARPVLADGGGDEDGGPPPTQCSGVLPPGTYEEVVVPEGASCTFLLGTITVTEDVVVLEKATLWDQAASIGGDILAFEPAGIGIGYGGNVGHNVVIDGVTGSGPTGGFPPGNNYLCNTKIGGSAFIFDGESTASQFDIGAPLSCSTPLTVAGDLVVADNENAVNIGGNTVKHNLWVVENAPKGATVNGNMVTGRARCFDNHPFSGALNTDSHGMSNTCNGSNP